MSLMTFSRDSRDEGVRETGWIPDENPGIPTGHPVPGQISKKNTVSIPNERSISHFLRIMSRVC